MACNLNVPLKTEENLESNLSDEGPIMSVEEEKGRKKVQHHFSEPWEDSDVILVVENEKFHVHRLILSMNSPVFKAMFKSQFKESTANEIPLPEKKANEVLDFLQKVYGPQYIQQQVEITMENVKHLLKLSDEYQVKKLIFDPCVKFLEDQPKTKENVMKILTLAELYNIETVRQGCNDLLGDMDLDTLSETVHLQDLEKEKIQFYLEQRIERLETFLDTLYPQFMGVVACLIWLMKDHDAGRYVRWCTHHFSEGTLNFRLDISSSEIHKCEKCREMFRSLGRGTYKTNWGRQIHHYGGRNHFDDDLLSVMEDFCKLQRKFF